MSIDAIARMKRRIAKRQIEIDARRHLPSHQLNTVACPPQAVVPRRKHQYAPPDCSGYHYPCSYCTFRGVTEGALNMHIKLHHT